MAQQGEKIVSGSAAGWIDTTAITRLTTKMHRIRWTIENVSEIPKDTNLTGPDFYLTHDRLASIAFQRNVRHFYVYLTNKSDIEFQIERKIFLFDCYDNKLHEEKDSTVFTLEIGKAIDIIGSVEDKCRFDALPNNTLIIDLSICMRGVIMTEISPFQQFTDPKKKLIEDLKAMREDSIKSDVTLQVGNEQIPAHWSILCSRSPYFNKMYDIKMSERVQNSITITDLTLCTLQKVVAFFYTADFVENDLEELFELYYAADKYEVMDLRDICSSKIMAKATADNACQIFQLAHRHNDDGFKMQAMDFIQFHSDEVFQTDGWKKFQVSEPLASDFISFCLKKNKSA